MGVTENVLFNRLRTDGDQIFQLGWAMVLQRAGGSNRIAHAICRASGGMFAPMPEVESLDIDQPFVSSCSHYQKVLRLISTLKRLAPNRGHENRLSIGLCRRRTGIKTGAGSGTANPVWRPDTVCKAHGPFTDLR